LRGDGSATARFSANDRGDPVGFRRALADLPLEPSLLARFLEGAAPGRVQTTVGAKWSRATEPERLTLYFEELSMAPDGGSWIAQHVARLADATPPEGALAVALDVRPGHTEPLAFKAYLPRVDRRGAPGGAPLPGSLEAFRRALPFHERGTRRMLVATRWAPGGARTGHKLLWVPEVRFADPRAVWDHTQALRERLKLPPSRPGSALDVLASDPEMYPDLVSLDSDADGVPRSLTVYVAVSPWGKKRRASSM